MRFCVVRCLASPLAKPWDMLSLEDNRFPACLPAVDTQSWICDPVNEHLNRDLVTSAHGRSQWSSECANMLNGKYGDGPDRRRCASLMHDVRAGENSGEEVDTDLDRAGLNTIRFPSPPSIRTASCWFRGAAYPRYPWGTNVLHSYSAAMKGRQICLVEGLGGQLCSSGIA